MAAEKKQEKLSVEDRLKTLYQLQTILSEIDRIRTVRGELPAEVEDLKNEIEGLNTRISRFNSEINEQHTKLAAAHAKIEEARALIARYEEQMNDVSNNRQYDMLSKETEFQNLEIQLAEKHIHEYENVIEQRKKSIEDTEAILADKRHILEEKESELDQIVSETRQEEENLRQKAQGLEPLIDERTLTAFKRIRRNARNGLGVVYIERNACGGCFNRIPPQKQLEIKMRKKIIVCEYCGRILVDRELAGQPEEAPAK